MTAPEEQINILLYGLGAIGGFYAFILERNPGVSLSVCARSNYDAVKQSVGISNPMTASFGDVTAGPANRKREPWPPCGAPIRRTPADAGRTFDYVVCAHKALNQDAVPPQLKPVVSPETTIVIIQNGVGNEEPFRSAFPECTIISCVTWVGATQVSPGLIKHTKSEAAEFGLFPNPQVDEKVEKARLDRFTTLLENGGTKFTVEDNIQIKRWEKVVWNAAWNPITTLTMIDTQSWLKSSDEAMQMTRQLMRDVIDVGKRSGVPLEDDLVDRLITRILGMPGIGSSMQTDAKAGRPLEVDVILGTPVAKAKEFSMAVPTLRTVYALTTAVNLRLKGD